MSTGEPTATESGHGWFGGEPSEKDQPNWHLVGGLPYRTPGSEGGPGKRTGRDPGTAPWSDPYTEHPTREGKLYCCVVLDTYSRRVVG